MEYPTYLTLKTRVENELDLIDEDFISDTEMLGYFNRAVDQAEAQIHSIYEDYFLTKGTLSIVQGETDVTLPSNIYANKIRALIFQNGSRIYELRRLRGDREFLKRQLIDQYSSNTEDLNYIIRNDSAAAKPMIELSPSAGESGAYLTIWYIRNANKFTIDTDPCDIPEFSDYIVGYVKLLCAQKERDVMLIATFQTDLAKLENDMIVALKDMVPDGDNTIEPDTTVYNEHS